MHRICAVRQTRQDHALLEIRQVMGKVQGERGKESVLSNSPFQSVRLTHSSRDHKRDPYCREDMSKSVIPMFHRRRRNHTVCGWLH